MTKSINPEYIIAQVKRIVESDKKSEIRLNANGGNSILLVCPPEMEYEFVQKIYSLMDESNYSIIDLNEILISFVNDNKSDIEQSFELLKGSIHQIFKAPSGEISADLFNQILEAIKNAIDRDKIPILIHNGAIYGSGIDNIHLMESELVMNATKPLIILYPATQDGEQLMFLNSRPASKYRCLIVN